MVGWVGFNLKCSILVDVVDSWQRAFLAWNLRLCEHHHTRPLGIDDVATRDHEGEHMLICLGSQRLAHMSRRKEAWVSGKGVIKKNMCFTPLGTVTDP